MVKLKSILEKIIYLFLSNLHILLFIYLIFKIPETDNEIQKYQNWMLLFIFIFLFIILYRRFFKSIKLNKIASELCSDTGFAGFKFVDNQGLIIEIKMDEIDKCDFKITTVLRWSSEGWKYTYGLLHNDRKDHIFLYEEEPNIFKDLLNKSLICFDEDRIIQAKNGWKPIGIYVLRYTKIFDEILPILSNRIFSNLDDY